MGEEEEDLDAFLYGDSEATKSTTKESNSQKKLPSFKKEANLEELYGNDEMETEEKHTANSEAEEAEEEDEDEDDYEIVLDSSTAEKSMAALTATTLTGATAADKSSTDALNTSAAIDLDAIGQIDGIDITDLDLETFGTEKGWKKPGADITDFFNYGFTESTWRLYCLKQRRLREEYNGVAVNIMKNDFDSSELPPLPQLSISTERHHQGNDRYEQRDRNDRHSNRNINSSNDHYDRNRSRRENRSRSRSPPRDRSDRGDGRKRYQSPNRNSNPNTRRSRY